MKITNIISFTPVNERKKKDEEINKISNAHAIIWILITRNNEIILSLCS